MSDLFTTADLYDAAGEKCSSCETQFRQYGGRRLFLGKVRSVKCLNDNVLVKRTLEMPSDGEVLVVDGSAYLGSALIGDVIAGLGAKSGWSGVVVFGAIRDTTMLARLDFGVKAIGSNPRKCLKNGTGQVDISVSFGGVTFTPGQWLYSDDDGILVSDEPLR